MRIKFYKISLFLIIVFSLSVLLSVVVKAETQNYDVCLCVVYEKDIQTPTTLSNVFKSYKFMMNYKPDGEGQSGSMFLNDFNLGGTVKIGDLPEATMSNCANFFSLPPFDQAGLAIKLSTEKQSYSCSYYKCEWTAGGSYQEFTYDGAWTSCVPQTLVTWTKTYNNGIILEVGKEHADMTYSIDIPIPGVTMTCEGCDGLGTLTNIKEKPYIWLAEGNYGMASLKFLKDIKPGVYPIKITAHTNQSGQSGEFTITKQINFTVDLNCESLISGLNCTSSTPKQLEACKKACSSNEECEWSGDACKKKGDVSGDASTGAQSSASTFSGYTKEYLEKTYQVPADYTGPLPPCAFSGTCRSVNDLLQLLINFGKGMFAVLGSVAFAFFVYGGFTMILSMGNAEKQKKGQQILVAAVIGLVIAFSAYMLINFMLDALGVAPDFRGIK